MDSITNFFTEHLILSGVGIAFILGILSRLLPNEWQKKSSEKVALIIALFFKGIGGILFGFGRTISGFGTLKTGKKAWNLIENFFENSLDLWIYGFMDTFRKEMPKGVLIYLYERLKMGWNYDNNLIESK